MHVISRRRLKEGCSKDSTLERPLADWFKVASNAEWGSLVDVRKTYPSADYADPYTVFNIRGNSYRLIVKIEYKWQLIFVIDVKAHPEYERWNHERNSR